MDVWYGREWEDYCVSLLQKRYAVRSPHSLQLVPARHEGDLGLEAFSFDGYGYQCYAAEEPLSTRDLYEKQRDKLTTDLSKLKAKSADVHALLGQVVIHRYVFMVHRHDSRKLISHAHEKSRGVRAWKLPFISEDFSIIVETADDYAAEKAELHAIPKQFLALPNVDANAVEAWVSDNTGMTTEAERKLTKIVPSQGQRDAALGGLLEQYLDGENALELLRTSSPDGHQAILSAKAQREKLLVLQYPPEALKTRGALVDVATTVQEAYLKANPVVTSEFAETLAWATIADWLMRCPLDFGASDEG